MIVGQAGGGTDWLLALVPTVSLLLAFVTAFAATYPQRKDRRQQEKVRQEREGRLDAAADVVLGRLADPNRGQVDRVPGLAERVNEHTRQLNEVNRKIGQTKDGRPLAQVLEEALAGIARVGMAQQDQDEMIETQGEILKRTGQQIEAHERRAGRADERLNQHDAELRQMWQRIGGNPQKEKP